MFRPSDSLSNLKVLIIDCQATGAAARGHRLEVGWKATTDTRVRLIALSNGERIPAAAARLTGITELKRLTAATAPVALPWEPDRHSTSRDSRLR